MDAIIMPSTTLLINYIQDTYPHVRFLKSDHFSWNPTSSTVTFTESHLPYKLLHEIAHALLNHNSYRRDIELLAMERAAWGKASELGKQHDIHIPEDVVEDALDTYRNWLHLRSTCPACSSTGLQIQASSYHCVSCYTTWRVNEARTCELRRYTIEKTSQ